jgi:hypothetical protein
VLAAPYISSEPHLEAILLLPPGEVGRGQNYIRVNSSFLTGPPKSPKGGLLAGANLDLLALLISWEPHLEAILLLPLGEVGRGQNHIRVNSSFLTGPP